MAASAGFAASGLTVWVLRTGEGGAAAGALNQYRSIWSSVGSSFAGLSGQFDGVQSVVYWSGTVFAPLPSFAWGFIAGSGVQGAGNQLGPSFAVAVLPGGVAAAIPEPQMYALMLMGLGAVLLARRKRTP